MRFPRSIVDRLVRRKAAFHKTPLHRYQVRVARTVQEYEDAFRLVQLSYVYQGIARVGDDELRITPQHQLPEATVLVAYEGENLVGTMTVTLDSAAGLPLDKDYPAEINALRRRGARLVEYGSYAIVERCWSTGVSNLLYLAATMVASQIVHATNVVIGINPTAAHFYRAVFNFETLGQHRTHAELRAPVVGMVQDLSAFESFLLRHYRRPMRSGALPGEHFFGKPLPCVAIPQWIETAEFERWKMPPNVFRVLFAKHPDRRPRAQERALLRRRATGAYSHLEVVS